MLNKHIVSESVLILFAKNCRNYSLPNLARFEAKDKPLDVRQRPTRDYTITPN